MRWLATYVMAGPVQAVLVVAVSALLSLLLPPVSFLSGAAAGLVTLRLGARRGLVVVAGATVAAAVFSAITLGDPTVGAGFLPVLWLPVWVLGLSLRRTGALARSVLLAGLFGAALVVGMHLALDDPAAWWREVFQEVLREALPGQGAEAQRLSAQLAPLMTGAMAAALVLSLLGCLFIARWWQAMLYNPGGFRDEFHRLQLGRSASLLTLTLIAVAVVAGEGAGTMAVELLMVAMVLHLLQGLAVVHRLVADRGAGLGWLVGVYALWVIAAPQMSVVLALIGVIDAWVDIRTHMGRKGTG